MNEETPLASSSLHALADEACDDNRLGGIDRKSRRVSVLVVLCASIFVVAGVVLIGYKFRPTNNLTSFHSNRNEQHEDVPVMGSTWTHGVPPPSKQDWCMAPGQYKFFGTYRSPHDVAEGGLFHAPGRFQGTILTDQTDDTVHFHLVNMTYGNALSPHHHVPNAKDEPDMFDAYCTIHSQSDKVSGCYVPKFFPKKGSKHNKSRCAKLEFPSMTGFGLCRELAMGHFELLQDDSMNTLGSNIPVNQWVSRLSTTDPQAPNDYDGELRLFLQTVGDDRLVIPLTHWLTSDDQTLESSFQVMDWKQWDSSTVPEIPHGCEDAIDLAEVGEESTMEVEDHQHGRVLKAVADANELGPKLALGRCPFGAIHRHLVLPTVP